MEDKIKEGNTRTVEQDDKWIRFTKLEEQREQAIKRIYGRPKRTR